MPELVRNGPMYSDISTDWQGDDAGFDEANHRFSWCNSEGWLFQQCNIPFEAGKTYVLRFVTELNGSTVYPRLGGNAGPDMNDSGEYAAVITAGSDAPGLLSFHERTGSSAANSWISNVSLREVALVSATVPVETDLLTA